EFGWQPRLLAELVGCDPVELVVTLDWNGLGAVGVDGVISPFAEQTKAVLLQVLDQVTPFDGHSPARWTPARKDRFPKGSPTLAPGTPEPFREERPSTSSGTL